MNKKTFHIVFILFAAIMIFSACNQQNKKRNTNNELEGTELFNHNESESMEMYAKLMSSFNPNWEIEEPASEEYPEYFGGAFIDNDGKFVVCITGDTTQYRKEVAQILDNNDFLVESCEYSYREMMQVMDKIDEFLSNEDVPHDHPFITNFAGAIADVFDNRVVIRLLEVNDEIKDAFKKEITPSSVVKFEEGEMPEMM